MQLNPYLLFDGRCREAFTLYQQVLGGSIESMFLYRGTPAEAHVPADWQDKILHATLVSGDAVLMGSDAPPDRFSKSQGFSVSIGVTDPAEADRIFAALAEDGSVTMPIGGTFFANRFGMLVDPFGIPWMIICQRPAAPEAG
jgi:PhnB protein